VNPCDLPQLSGANHLDDAAIIRQIVMNMVPHLRNAFVVERAVGHGSPFRYAIAQRFFDKNVFARFERLNRGNCVPMIGRHNGHRVDLLQFQELPDIAKFLRRLPARSTDDLNRTIGVPLVDVTDGRDAHIRVLEEAFQPARSLAADTDHAEDDLIVRALRCESRPDKGCGSCGYGCGCKKGAA
jgi:hypothetical protein